MKYLISIVLCIFIIPVLGQVNYTYYSKLEVEQDLDYAFEKLTNIHPIFLNKEELAICQNRFLTIKESLKDSMTHNEIYLQLAPLFASLNDEHTEVIVPIAQRIEYVKAGGKSFPFFVNIRKDSIYVSYYCGNDSNLFHGEEQILEINGIDATEIVHNMQRLYGGKSVAIKQKLIADKFRFLIWMLYGFEGDYELKIKNNQQEIHRIAILGISSADFIKNIKRKPKTIKKIIVSQ